MHRGQTECGIVVGDISKMDSKPKLSLAIMQGPPSFYYLKETTGKNSRQIKIPKTAFDMLIRSGLKITDSYDRG